MIFHIFLFGVIQYIALGYDLGDISFDVSELWRPVVGVVELLEADDAAVTRGRFLA